MSPLPEKIATIKLTDEVSAIVSGIRITELNDLFEKYGLYAKNYFFDPRYQMERWDGKIRFFKRGGKTFIQLIPEIIEYLDKCGYKINLVDERVPFSITPTKVDKDYFKKYGWELGKHQVKAINAAFKHNNGIIRVGTGGGKTLITGVLCHRYIKEGFKIIVIVPNKDLVVQTKEEIETFGFSVGTYYQNGKDLDNDVVVSTWQSLANNRKIITMFDAVFVDECHGSKTSTQLASILGNEGRDIPVRIGLTGSLPKHHADLMSVLCHLGPVRAIVKSSELIERGWLAQLNLIMYEYKEDFKDEWEEFKKAESERVDEEKLTYTKFKNNVLFPNFEAEKKYLIHNDERLDILVAFIKEATERYGNSFVLVNTVAFGKKLAKALGEDAIFIASSIKDRKPIYDAFQTNNGIIGVATYSLASTGLNIPRIFNFFTVDGGKSSIRVIQSIGRSLRRAKDKDTANVIDFYSDLKFSKRHAGARRKIYKEEEYPYKVMKVNNDTNISELIAKLAEKDKKTIQDEVLE